MASPPGANRVASSSRGAPLPLPLAAHFPSRAAGPFLRQHHQPAASSPGIGRAVMNGENGLRHIQEEQQWQQHSHVYNRGTEQYVPTSSRGDEPGTIPREMRVENGYGVIGRREGGPASSYWDLLRAHLSDLLTGVLMDDAMILSCGHSYASSGMQHLYRMLFALQFRHLNVKKSQQKH